MDFLRSLILVSEKAANIARLCRQEQHLFELLIEKKSSAESNPRFVEDFKTLADVLIQQLVKHDLGRKFHVLIDEIKGEENNVFSNKLGETICVEIKDNVQQTAELLKIVLNGDEKAAGFLATEVHREIDFDIPDLIDFPINLQDLGIWIDPIDSTAEYINGSEDLEGSGLKCVTVLIGAFSKSTNLPIIGVINQPFFTKKEGLWSGKIFWGTPYKTSLPASPPPSKLILVSGSEDASLINKLKKHGYQISEASGCGYKILSVICGKADSYLISKNSTFKWDTCGPQAVLRALGGDVLVFSRAMKGERASIKYGNGGSTCNEGGIIAFRDENILNDIVTCLHLE